MFTTDDVKQLKVLFKDQKTEIEKSTQILLDKQNEKINQRFQKQGEEIDKKLQNQDDKNDKKFQTQLDDQGKKIDKNFKILLQEQRDEIVGTLIKYIDKHTASKDELAELKARIDLLPTKDEYFTKMDKIAGEYKEFSEETPTINHQLKNHEDRLETIETSLNIAC